MYDIAVIGGGVIGGAILRELSKYNVKTILLEKSSDVCCGQSRANSGIVHAGFDAKPDSLKAKFNVENFVKSSRIYPKRPLLRCMRKAAASSALTNSRLPR